MKSSEGCFSCVVITIAVVAVGLIWAGCKLVDSINKPLCPAVPNVYSNQKISDIGECQVYAEVEEGRYRDCEPFRYVTKRRYIVCPSGTAGVADKEK